MEISNLTLINFRNFSQANFNFDQNLTVLVGPNGVGKTNLAESLFLLSTGSTWRAGTDADLVKFGENFAQITARINFGQDKFTSQIQILGKPAVKKFLTNGLSKRMSDFLGRFVLILFSPEEIDLVAGTPAGRRKHLDFFLSNLDRNYHQNLVSFEKVLRNRNKLLIKISQGVGKLSELEFWDNNLVNLGNILHAAREVFFDFLEAGPNFKFKFLKSHLDRQILVKNRQKELILGMTLSGPHRDDFIFELDGRNLTFFGSRGEARLAVLALKLVELEFAQKKLAENRFYS